MSVVATGPTGPACPAWAAALSNQQAMSDLLSNITPRTAEDYDRGANPFGAFFPEEQAIANAWLREKLAEGPTPRVLALPDQARTHVQWFGQLLHHTLADPAWAADDPAGRDLFLREVQTAFTSAAELALAVRFDGQLGLFDLIDGIPTTCYGMLPISEAIAEAAVDRSPDAPHPVLMDRLMDRLRPSTLRRFVAEYPMEPWVMRALARLGREA